MIKILKPVSEKKKYDYKPVEINKLQIYAHLSSSNFTFNKALK